MLRATAVLVLAALPAVLGAAVGGDMASQPTAAPAPPAAQCTGAFEEHVACGSNCPKSCTNPNPVCDETTCAIDQCQCIEGYARNLVDGACIPEDSCGRGPEDECRARCRADNGGLLDCSDGNKCTATCASGVIAYLQNAKTTQYCGGANDEYVTCATVSCLPHDVCEANEVWRDCGRCEKSCNDLTPCESECPQMCVCKDGFSRNDAGDCVEKCCPRLTCDEPRPCPDDMIEVKTPQQVVDGCLVACHQTTCMPKYLEDGAECGSEDEDIPEELRNLECRYPSSCLHADFDFIPVGPRQSPDAPYEPAVCGQYGAGIVVREYLDHVATNGARACDRACTDNDECVAWQYEHRGGGRLGYCTLVRSYNEQYPYFSYWWYTAHYVSALKR